MKKIAVVVVTVILVLILGYALPRSRFWPQERIVLGLPYFEDDPPMYMEPMGETINHPKPEVPLGHPGIDFKWDHSAQIRASADGVVDKVESIEDHGYKLVTIFVRSGKYKIEYAELGQALPGIEKGVKVKKGQPIGLINPETQQLHWAFGYSLPILEPLCPLTYFDDESRKTIESDWLKAGYNARDKFPDLCSGDFAGRDL